MININALHGGDIASLAREYPGVKALDFSANMNPLGMPDSVRRAVAASVDGCVHYPDPECRALREALSAYESVPVEEILCGNGAADLIYRVAFGLRPRNALLLSPSFAEYELALAASGCKIDFHPLTESDGFLPDESLLPRIPGHELVFLCNPNNPTGRLIDPALLSLLLRRCRESGAVLAADECFLDFVAEPALHTLKRELDGGGLLILKAFTKSFAMPGLRLGYLLCSDRDMLSRIGNAGQPWAVSVPAAFAGIAAAKETGWMAKTRPVIEAGRKQLTEGLTDLGCKVYPSDANFLLFRSKPGLAEKLRPEGVLLRDCGNFRGLPPGYYRAAVRLPKENDALLRALSFVSPVEGGRYK